jgi:hypothetical protein
MTCMRSTALWILILTGVCLLSDFEAAIAGPRILATVVHISDGDTL